MTNAKKIEGTIEAWEEGKLGNSETHARPSKTVTGDMVNEALGLQMISIRLEKELIDLLKAIAKIHGIGYQPLIRDQLHRFANAEARSLVMNNAGSLRKNENNGSSDDDPPEMLKQA
jgi:predicted DNA binding CopG/RHH family protein